MLPKDCGDLDTACLQPCRFTGHGRWADDRAEADTERWGASGRCRLTSLKSHQDNVGLLNGNLSRQSMANIYFSLFSFLVF